MWRVFQVLSRFGNVLLFVALEFIALLLIINLNDSHQRVSQGFFLQVSSGLNEVNDNIRNYFSLGRENEKLMSENIALQGRILSLENELAAYKNQTPYFPGFLHLPDSLLPLQGYDFIPSQVISNTTGRNYNYLTLNKGRKHGVTPGMGVLSPDGVAGMVIESSKNYALAISVLNLKFNLSVKLLHNQNIGPLTWNGVSPDFAYLENIPQTSEIIIGDTVVTSGYSNIFPAGLYVGTVEQYAENPREGFFRVQIRLAANFRSLGNVYIVKQNYQQEIDSLETNRIID